MNSNYSNANMLDMIFEHRNKAYGAYVLRRDYNKSLKQAMLIALSSVFLLCMGNLIRERLQGFTTNPTGPIIDIMTTEIKNMVAPIVEPPKPPKTNEVMAKATVENPTKKVVAENQAHADSVATKDDLKDLESGLHTNTQPTGGLGVTDGTGSNPGLEVQNTKPVMDEGPVDIAEIMPEFPGGEKALFRFLRDNTRFPIPEREMGLGGRVISQFTVNEDGSITDIKILKSPASGFDKEVVRVVKMLPAFKPGRQAGRAVKVRYILPFTFTVQD